MFLLLSLKARENKMKHTPGPWTIVDENELGTENSEKVPYGIWADGDDESVRIAGIMCEKLSPSEVGANARLISAAPQLLDAIMAIFEHPEMEHVSPEFRALLDAVALIVDKTKGNK